jgi:hypothetical protein
MTRTGSQGHRKKVYIYVYLPSEHNIHEIIKGLEDGTEKSVPNYQPVLHKRVALVLFLLFVLYKDLMMD